MSFKTTEKRGQTKIWKTSKNRVVEGILGEMHKSTGRFNSMASFQMVVFHHPWTHLPQFFRVNISKIFLKPPSIFLSKILGINMNVNLLQLHPINHINHINHLSSMVRLTPFNVTLKTFIRSHHRMRQVGCDRERFSPGTPKREATWASTHNS